MDVLIPQVLLLHTLRMLFFMFRIHSHQTKMNSIKHGGLFSPKDSILIILIYLYSTGGVKLFGKVMTLPKNGMELMVQKVWTVLMGFIHGKYPLNRRKRIKRLR